MPAAATCPGCAAPAICWRGCRVQMFPMGKHDSPTEDTSSKLPCPICRTPFRVKRFVKDKPRDTCSRKCSMVWKARSPLDDTPAPDGVPPCTTNV